MPKPKASVVEVIRQAAIEECERTSQNQLAKRIKPEVDRAVIHKFVKGGGVSLQTLDAIAEALGVRAIKENR